MVAAGLWNPIVFRRINKSWLADEFIDELESFYPRLEDLLEARFYKPIPVWRIHGSKQELDKWCEKKHLSGFSPYLYNPPEKLEKLFGKTPQFGEGQVKHAGYLDLSSFLTNARNFFQKKGLLQEGNLSLEPTVEELNKFVAEISSIKSIIDCRGSQSSHSKWWSYLPFGLTKGEVLTIKCPELSISEVFNAGFFVLPLGNDLFRVGATFNWKEKSSTPTLEGRNELRQKLEEYIPYNYEIVDHKAGIRPTVQDRRPLFGQHPEVKRLYLFNGLGTKGVMLAPYLSSHFIDYFLDGKPLKKETDIRRFDHLIGSHHPQIHHPS